MNDVTRLRRLETMRRDFVANVSHELKTPITSIKGYVETLLEDPPDDRPEMDRFLDHHQPAGRPAGCHHRRPAGPVPPGTGRRQQGGIERHELAPRPGAGAGGAGPGRTLADADRVTLDCGAEQVRAAVNAPLLEQAVGNLLHNALKYSPPEAPVRLRAAADNGTITISVTDQGPGIAAEHLPRLFERFYRVDKARSRQMGGTGLGLAIVKHIAQAHQGRVTVDSDAGPKAAPSPSSCPEEISA